MKKTVIVLAVATALSVAGLAGGTSSPDATAVIECSEQAATATFTWGGFSPKNTITVRYSVEVAGGASASGQAGPAQPMGDGGDGLSVPLPSAPGDYAVHAMVVATGGGRNVKAQAHAEAVCTVPTPPEEPEEPETPEEPEEPSTPEEPSEPDTPLTTPNTPRELPRTE